VHGSPIDSLENSYVVFFQKLGGQLFPIPNTCVSVPDFINQIAPQGIILSGGGDISAHLYGGKSQPAGNASPERERIEYALLHEAVLRKIPVLGICRGMQVINVYFGGSLVADIVELGDTPMPLIGTHHIAINDEMIIKHLGEEHAIVNSYHTQGVPLDGLGNGLRSFCRSSRFPITEGIRHVSLPIAGVQWHPERGKTISPLDRLLCEAFLHKTLYWEVDY